MIENLKKVMNSLPIQADWVGLRNVEESVFVSSYRNGKPDTNQFSVNKGVMVEVLIDGQFAYSGTNDLSEKGLTLAAHQAAHIAKKSSQWRLHNFSSTQRIPHKAEYISPRKLPIKNFVVKDIQHFLNEVDVAMQISPKIINRFTMAWLHQVKTHYVSSNGADIHQDFNFVLTDMSVTAKDGNQIQTRHDDGALTHCFQIGLEGLQTQSYKQRAAQLSEEALSLLNAEVCPNSTMDLVVDPSQMYLQIHESIGHPLELDRILGDERNYAGSSFIQLHDFGTKQYGSKLLNVVFEPTLSGQFASYSHDDLGQVAEKHHLIKDGLLVRGLGGAESQTRSRVQGVANSRASSWNRPPIDRMANLNIEPGTSTFKDIIGSIEKGVFIKSNTSWSIDDYRLKFQFGCEFGQLIENGKLTKIVRNPNYRSTSAEFWHKLAMVGDASTYRVFGSPFCGKGEPNQVIRVGHASPTCLFRDIEVFGGG